MHELGIVEGWLSTARQAADGHRVKRCRVSVGELAGVDFGALDFAFQAAAPRFLGTDQAKLAVTRVPARLRCAGPGGCGAEYAFAEQGAICPRCGATTPEWISGLELRLDSIVIDEQEPPNV